MNGSAGYSGKPLWQKLGLRAGMRCAVLDAPHPYATLTGFDTTSLEFPAAPTALDFAHAFVPRQAALAPALDALVPRMDPGAMIWISWPKKSSPLFRDLTEDGVRNGALPRGWVDVKVCAVDEVWSGLKLLRRRK